MRYIFGTIGIIAALGFVGYAAVTSFHTAASMTTQFPALAGAAAASMVAWEALGALFVQQCWRNGSRLLAIGGAVLVLAASIYLLRLDLRFHVTGQSDLSAAREATIENRDMVREEHAKAIARRDELQKVKTPTAFQKSELAAASRRIADLEPRLWSAETVHAGGVPEAGWASRMLPGISSDRQWWADALMVTGLLFWALARMLALPVAVASMQMAAPSRREARTAPKPVAAPDAGLIVAPPAPAPALRVEAPVPALPDVSGWREDLRRKPADAAAEPVCQDSLRTEAAEAASAPAAPAIGPHLAYSADDAPRPLTKGEKRSIKKNSLATPDEDAERKTVELWTAECLTSRPDRKHPPSSGDCHASLLAYCEREQVAPVDQVRMTQILTEILKPVKIKGRYPRNAKERIWPGWNLSMPAAGRLRASA